MSENKYHVNDNGKIGKCNAKTKCPFSSEETHFSDKLQIEKFNDYINENNLDLSNKTKTEKEKIIKTFKKEEFKKLLKNKPEVKELIRNIFKINLDIKSNLSKELKEKLELRLTENNFKTELLREDLDIDFPSIMNFDKNSKESSVRIDHDWGPYGIKKFFYIMKREEENPNKVPFEILRFNDSISSSEPWSLAQKQSYIVSTIQHKHSIPISIMNHLENDGKTKVHEVLNGKKRLQAVLEFADNKFPIHIRGKEVYYKDLEEKLRYWILEQNHQVFYLWQTNGMENPIPDKDKLKMYLADHLMW